MTVKQQLDQSNRHSRRFRRSGTAVVAACLGIAALLGLLATSCAGNKSAAQPTVVTGTEFRLVDDKGVTRARLAMERGYPLLRFLDEQGRSLAIMGLQEYGPTLVLVRENGTPGANIGLSQLGPAMAFGDNKGRLRFLLTAPDTSAASIVLRDTAGRVTWSAP